MLMGKIKLLFGDQSKFLERWEKWVSLQSKLKEELKSKLSYKILDEIVSDISGTLLTSLPSILPLVSRYTPDIYNLDYNSHPPIYLRFEYCLKTVEDILKLEEFVSEYSDVLETLTREFNNYLRIFENSEKKSFLELRNFIIDNFKESIDLTKLSITSYLLGGDDILFNKEKYEQAVKVKEELSEGKHLTNISEDITGEKYGIEPRVLIMAGWLRRLDEFKKLENQPSNLFVEFRRYRSRFYPKIVLYLHQYYENKYRRW